MFHLIGVWHQVAAVSAWTGLSLGALAGLAALAYFVPFVRRLAIAAAITVVCSYIAMIHGNVTGLADGRAEVQVKWDAEKAAEAAARAAEKERQATEAELQKSRDDATAQALAKQASEALDAIQNTPAADDGAVPKVLLDSWARARAARGLK
jgi:hypothetical protein